MHLLVLPVFAGLSAPGATAEPAAAEADVEATHSAPTAASMGLEGSMPDPSDLEPGTSPRVGSGACRAQHDAAAYVCCDGAGGFTVCRGPVGGHRVLLGCIDQHERDHLTWFAKHLPDACETRPRGACHFEMTLEDFRDLECSGYRTEYRCLTQSRGLANGRRRTVADLLWRQRQLRERAESRFACSTHDW